MEQLPSAFISSSHFWVARSGGGGGVDERGDLATDSAGVTARLGTDSAFCFWCPGSPWLWGLGRGGHGWREKKEKRGKGRREDMRAIYLSVREGRGRGTHCRHRAKV